MKTLIVLAALVAVACAAQISEQRLRSEWQSFKTRHGKSYATPLEEEHRMKIFKSNLIKVEEHNERYAQGAETFKTAINHLSDLHLSEIRERLNGLRVDSAKLAQKHGRTHRAALGSKNLKWDWWCLWWCSDDDSDDSDFVPDADNSTLDWRQEGLVTGVKDQGQCGSCWSFSSTGALEGQYFKKTGKLVSLSEQNLMDCSWKYGNMACNGGLMTAAFQYVQANKGIDTEASYPYTERSSRTCGYKVADNAGTISNYVEVNPTEADLKDAITKVGPVSVGINAALWSFSHYSEGVYYDSSCDNELDHGVLAVGYGNDNGHAYWLVKNSWGTSWGEEGYVRMARNRKNHCGIADMASYPVV